MVIETVNDIFLLHPLGVNTNIKIITSHLALSWIIMLIFVFQPWFNFFWASWKEEYLLQHGLGTCVWLSFMFSIFPCKICVHVSNESPLAIWAIVWSPIKGNILFQCHVWWPCFSQSVEYWTCLQWTDLFRKCGQKNAQFWILVHGRQVLTIQKETLLDMPQSWTLGTAFSCSMMGLSWA